MRPVISLEVYMKIYSVQESFDTACGCAQQPTHVSDIEQQDWPSNGYLNWVADVLRHHVASPYLLGGMECSPVCYTLVEASLLRQFAGSQSAPDGPVFNYFTPGWCSRLRGGFFR